MPLLAVDDSEVAPLWVADGYQRVCASYHLDEKTPVPCRIVARKS